MAAAESQRLQTEIDDAKAEHDRISAELDEARESAAEAKGKIAYYLDMAQGFFTFKDGLPDPLPQDPALAPDPAAGAVGMVGHGSMKFYKRLTKAEIHQLNSAQTRANKTILQDNESPAMCRFLRTKQLHSP